MKFKLSITAGLLLVFVHSLSAEASTQEYTLRAGKNDRLLVIIEHDWSNKTGLENVTCKFLRLSGGVRTLIGSETRGVGFRSETVICVGNFLNNGRKQVLVFMVHGATFGKVFDFDGHQIKSVYDSSEYGPRVWLRCFDSDGQRLIEEGWTPTGYSEPGFSIHRKSDNLFVRLMRWDGKQWSPIKFHFIDGQPVPVRSPRRKHIGIL